MSTGVFANAKTFSERDYSVKINKKAATPYPINSNYIDIYYPSNNDVYYKGEKIKYKAGIVDVKWNELDNYWTWPLFKVYSDSIMLECYINNKVVPREDAVGKPYYIFISVDILKFKAPLKIKATAGKKKVTVTFKKAKGAQKTVIYKSKNRTKGFKKVKTISGKKFVDKKVSKNKRYYYKAKSYRNVHGKIYSSYSKTARSKKVR